MKAELQTFSNCIIKSTYYYNSPFPMASNASTSMLRASQRQLCSETSLPKMKHKQDTRFIAGWGFLSCFKQSSSLLTPVHLPTLLVLVEVFCLLGLWGHHGEVFPSLLDARTLRSSVSCWLCFPKPVLGLACWPEALTSSSTLSSTPKKELLPPTSLVPKLSFSKAVCSYII